MNTKGSSHIDFPEEFAAPIVLSIASLLSVLCGALLALHVTLGCFFPVLSPF